ncbi:MAG: hypothetical protein B7Z42_12100 [Brevundimonas sp. 12-68-7]|uniref:DUF4160 domain-containing protein n=1 Tax=Brevundimonas subvibrioides TaxID=74313 RepID=A0A258FP57_9CAUL|nr:MAG: hypothetical protein B7Z42_12100 [Brevundimonas sp. 12-68-7]OYX33987.1 MAG: hypothetical protein B7Z01_07100 [Brevundimonas subvibrioides]
MYRAPPWKIAVYGRDHGVPHFHVEGRGWRCSVAISTLELIIGYASKPALTSAIGWASQHQDELLAKWRELNHER